ncbi:hypothetical protein IFR04_000531 [Cadophora malorum]|uniref:Uncharacterized protein n=1 Tax=Cadophora malorum TaxID=108018 RepID=A0A8H7WKJ7_9HELO|nr:hypothetical protein IFR04_000531 [Cadophora malorum]
MYLLSFLILSLATVLLPADAIPTQLHPRSQPYYCTPSTRFALGYHICTFASLIDPSFNTYLWLFDSQCGIVGSATDLTPSLLPASAGSGSHVYNFNSHLRYVAVTDLKDGQSPVVLKYAGKTWGGKKEQCWRDDNQWWVCSFEFNCEAAKSMGIASLPGERGEEEMQLGSLPFGHGEEGVLGVI